MEIPAAELTIGQRIINHEGVEGNIVSITPYFDIVIANDEGSVQFFADSDHKFELKEASGESA